MRRTSWVSVALLLLAAHGRAYSQAPLTIDSTLALGPVVAPPQAFEIALRRAVTDVPTPTRVVPVTPSRAQRRSRSTSASDYVVVGALVGALAGLGYGIHVSASCGQDCVPVLTPLIVVPLSMLGGVGVGAVAGGVTWIVTHPAAVLGRR